MPSIKTRGKNPGISLSQTEATRWQATIDDLAVCHRNCAPDSAGHEIYSKALFALRKALQLVKPLVDEPGEPAERKAG